MSPVNTAVIVVLVVAVAALTVGLVMAVRRRSLRRRFGPEYDRLVSERNDRRAAERELRARERRHAELGVRPLSQEATARYRTAWEEIQGRFVDDPAGAVGAADDLLTRLVAERGYPTGDFDEQVAYLSVEHARTLQNYRDAHDVDLRRTRGEVDTEQLRQALVHYRTLFADLLGDSAVERRAESVDRRAGAVDRRAESVDRRAESAPAVPTAAR